MNVIGLTDELRGDAELQCAAGFRAWLAETKESTWGNWEELKKHYPKVCQMSDDEAHFPLTSEGTGVRAMVFFHAQLILLGCIAPAPIAGRMPKHHHSPIPRTNEKQAAS